MSLNLFNFLLIGLPWLTSLTPAYSVPAEWLRPNQSYKRLQVILDVDAGVDDALSILFFLRHSALVDVKGITCLFGNVDLKTSCDNVLRTLRFLNREDIPVFQGAARGLIPTHYSGSDWNGADGFGGNAHKYPLKRYQSVQQMPAASFLVEAANRYPGELTLVILGPHTNVAIAQRLDDKFLSKFKAVFVMGGNYGGGGKPLSDFHEYDFFNFVQDPEAAHLVMNELNSTTYLLPIETCNANRITWDFYRNLTTLGNPKSRFFRDVSEYPAHVNRDLDKQDGIELCDLFMSAMVLYPYDLIKQSVLRSATVELCGKHTRAMMIVEAEDLRQEPTGKKKVPHINIVTELHSKVLKDIMAEMVM